MDTHMLMEIQALREDHGVRCMAAIGLVAERYMVDFEWLAVEHFEWLLNESGINTRRLRACLQEMA